MRWVWGAGRYPDICASNLLPRSAVLLGLVQATIVSQTILSRLRPQFVCFFSPQVSAILDELPAGLTIEIIEFEFDLLETLAQARSTHSLEEFPFRALEAQAPAAPTYQAHLAINVTTIEAPEWPSKGCVELTRSRLGH